MNEAHVKAHLRYTSLMEKRARVAFLSAVKQTVTNSDFAVGLAEITSGKTGYVEYAIIQRFMNVELPLSALEVVVRDTFAGGARITAKAYGNSIRKDDQPSINFDFDPALPDAIAWAKKNAADMVTQINVNTREAIRRRVMSAMADGEAPWELADSLKSVIGLTGKDIQAVENYRTAMLASGKSRTTVNNMARKYAKQLLAQRATVVARTEILKASNGGQQAYWKQGVSEGVIDEDEMERVWIATIPSERTCNVCGIMHGTTAPIDGDFNSSFGPIEFPPVHPQCRCTTGLQFKTSPVVKMNDNHDKLGRFASAPSGQVWSGKLSTDTNPRGAKALLDSVGLKTKKDHDAAEYPSASAARKAVNDYSDYSVVSIKTPKGTRHVTARLTAGSERDLRGTMHQSDDAPETKLAGGVKVNGIKAPKNPQMKERGEEFAKELPYSAKAYINKLNKWEPGQDVRSPHTMPSREAEAKIIHSGAKQWIASGYPRIRHEAESLLGVPHILKVRPHPTRSFGNTVSYPSHTTAKALIGAVHASPKTEVARGLHMPRAEAEKLIKSGKVIDALSTSSKDPKLAEAFAGGAFTHTRVQGHVGDDPVGVHITYKNTPALSISGVLSSGMMRPSQRTAMELAQEHLVSGEFNITSVKKKKSPSKVKAMGRTFDLDPVDTYYIEVTPA